MNNKRGTKNRDIKRHYTTKVKRNNRNVIIKPKYEGGVDEVSTTQIDEAIQEYRDHSAGDIWN